MRETTQNLTHNTGRTGLRRIKRLRLKDTRTAYRTRLAETERRTREEEQKKKEQGRAAKEGDREQANRAEIERGD